MTLKRLYKYTCNCFNVWWDKEVNPIVDKKVKKDKKRLFSFLDSHYRLKIIKEAGHEDRMSKTFDKTQEFLDEVEERNDTTPREQLRSLCDLGKHLFTKCRKHFYVIKVFKTAAFYTVIKGVPVILKPMTWVRFYKNYRVEK